MSIDKIKRSSVYIKQSYNGFMLYFRTIDDRNIFMKLFNNKNTYNFYTKYSLPFELGFKYLYCKKSKLYIPNTILETDNLTYRDIKMKYQYCVLIFYDTKMEEHSLRFVIFSILKELKTMKLLLDIQTSCTISIRVCLFNRILNER